jgi:hypothetical protein
MSSAVNALEVNTTSASTSASRASASVSGTISSTPAASSIERSTS